MDSFQRKAVQCIENNQSVLVSAHTSAGKTVVAEYAIAVSLRDRQRVIYTTPLKALSNQKYREMYEEFKDVGLMTGDTTINPTASCIVMTTEVSIRLLLVNVVVIMIILISLDIEKYVIQRIRGAVNIIVMHVHVHVLLYCNLV